MLIIFIVNYHKFTTVKWNRRNRRYKISSTKSKRINERNSENQVRLILQTRYAPNHNRWLKYIFEFGRWKVDVIHTDTDTDTVSQQLIRSIRISDMLLMCCFFLRSRTVCAVLVVWLLRLFLWFLFHFVSRIVVYLLFNLK